MDEQRPKSRSSDTPRLSPDAIASREFARASDGFDEREVRAFLREVADAFAALEAQGDGGTGDGPDGRAEELFAKLRETEDEEPEPPPAAPEVEAPPPVPAVEEALASVPEPEDEPEPIAESAAAEEPEPEPPLSEGDRARASRDLLIASIVPDALRSAKRLLQDEQNLLLDSARRARGRIDANRLLPEPIHHRDAWAALLAPAFDRAYAGGRSAGGRSRRASSAPERVVHELTAAVLAPLRERLKATINAVVAEGPYQSPTELHRAMASAIGARYREWRGAELESRLVDSLAAAFARGAYDGAPSGARLRWVTDAPGRCPDCDDNALEATVKGQSFPTGQTHPPAHPGCRCLVITGGE